MSSLKHVEYQSIVPEQSLANFDDDVGHNPFIYQTINFVGWKSFYQYSFLDSSLRMVLTNSNVFLLCFGDYYSLHSGIQFTVIFLKEMDISFDCVFERFLQTLAFSIQTDRTLSWRTFLTNLYFTRVFW